MPALALTLAVCQFLAPEPAVGVAGEEVRIEARDADGTPLVGVAVRATTAAGGESFDLGVTAGDGGVAFRPPTPGDWALRAELPGRELVLLAPLHVVAPARRWLYALFCVPAGLALLVWNWRRLARLRSEPPLS